MTKLEVGQIGKALIDGEYDRVYNQTSTAFQESISSAQFREAVVGFSEGVTSWEPNSQLALNGGNYYTYLDQGKKKGLIITMGEEKVIDGLQFKPIESFPESDKAQTKLAYGLPFKGEWYVFWGGEDVLSNYHYEYEGQRYAYDIIKVENGYSYKGDPTKKESYFAYGQEIVATQDGTVVNVVNNLKDNEPGATDAENPAGNMVAIDHGNGEYSIIAHLQEGSIKLKIGDKVSKGDLIGLCGNSGNTSEPHLHYQVSDNKDFFEGKAVRVQWEDGLKVRQGEVVKAK
ncbi:peptidase M23 [Cohnella abietis]|uniref:Peptidase M23 n=1 Tax=Cohnella abietis TaxID=2507935 RepID=A0A3T1D175_9BACL|nr:peptidase M23 [Cohnella abietis]